MKLFRVLLILMTIFIIILTINAVNLQGWNLLKHAVLTGWQAQFNFDFSCYLFLSALWLAWRYKFKTKGIAIATIAFFLGIFFFAPYLLTISLKTKGNMPELLLGENYK